MGEPEPLELELLKRGDNDEIIRAIRELGLLKLALDVVYDVFGSRYGPDVHTVALESIELLFTRAIRTCRTIDDIKPLLRTIARRQAINFLNVAFRKWETQFGGGDDDDDELPGPPGGPAAPPVPRFEVLGDILAEGLGMDAFQLAPVVDALVEGAELGEVERHLLVEHVIGGCTQREFSERHGIPLQGIGGRKTRLLNKVRAFLAGKLPEGMWTEVWRIVRRNQRRQKRRRNEPPPLI